MSLHEDDRRLQDHLHRDPRWTVVERAASSDQLKSSARLREFLFYVSECALRDAPGEVTEQQIGIHVFGRLPGYNSSEDSIVRTHARLLRQKLSAYFLDEGLQEKIVVAIPKGHYLPVFTDRTYPTLATEPAPELPPSTPSQIVVQPFLSSHVKPSKTKYFLGIWITLAFLLFLTLTAAAFWHPWRPTHSATNSVSIFWRSFFNDDPPFVIYSNARFTGDSISGLRYAAPNSSDDKSPQEYVDTYTGIGELASVYDLTKLFDAYHTNFTLKRSQLVAWDEAKARNLIFIGASVENPSLRVLQPTTDFTTEAHPGYASIINHHPRNGEPSAYSRPEHPLTTDYAIVALLPGVQPGKHVLLFSGLTTFGTQAAVEYLCRPESVAELLKLVSTPKGEIRPFEAVLQTNVGGGVALQTHLVTLRVH